MPRFTIVGVGEALFDIIDGEERLGGAPLNVAVHAHQLGRRRGGEGVIVSRVGQDDLGDRAIALVQQRDLSPAFLETDPDRATGRVYVDLGPDGQPAYDIVQNAAWDNLQFDPDLEDLAQRTTAVCYGSLAQRDAQTRNTLYRFLDACPHATKMFDVNLRQEFYDRRIIQRSVDQATILKLNLDELPIVAQMLAADPDPRAILDKRPGLQMIALTRGADGTRLVTRQDTVDGEPASYPAQDGADPVGAGDACAAAILVARALHKPLQDVADLANHLGAYVASSPGATPDLPESILDRV